MIDAIGIDPVADTLPDDISRLAREAEEEGHAHLRRLLCEWEDGTNRFSRKGEGLMLARDAGRIVGVGGLTQDPHLPGALRVRRFYVARDCRRLGLASQLARALLGGVRGPRIVTAHAPTPAAIAFWTAIGFAYRETPHHNLTLTIAGESR